jgi:transposase
MLPVLSGPSPRQQAGHMTEGRQPFTAEIKTLAKGPSTYDPLENNIDLAASPQRLGDERALSRRKTPPRAQESEESLAKTAKRSPFFMTRRRYELTDVDIIAPLLPNKPRGVPRVDDRHLINGILWRFRTGSPWPDVPERYGPAKRFFSKLKQFRGIPTRYDKNPLNFLAAVKIVAARI